MRMAPRGGRGADVSLEVQIAKQLPEFMLQAVFQAEGGEPLSILGPSGSGKTMLLRCIAGLEQPDSGRIVLNGRVLFDAHRKIRVPARLRRVGLLFQHFALFPHRTVVENVAFGVRNLPAADRERRITDLLERTHIRGIEQRHPRQLSGGEQQRVALARCLAVDPEALLLDEPLSSLDTHLRSQIETQLQEIFAEYRIPALLVTHSMEEAYRLCDRLLVLSRGRMAALGSKEEIFRRPPSVEVARLTGCKNISRVKLQPDGALDALDWGCELHVAQKTQGPPAYVGIRAHHIDFVESAMANGPADNIFPCWLIRSSDSPFRITLFLSLHESPKRDGAQFDLQAEVFKEKWERFRQRPLPWHVRLSPSALFAMPE
jgi:molybdate transport system permease protein